MSMFFSRSNFEKNIAMSKKSSAFEVDATTFLNDWVKGKVDKIKFFCEGGNNAWSGDIKVLYNGNSKPLFWISAKLPNAQGGQIVALKNSGGNYELSDESHEPVKKNVVTKSVIDHLNKNLEYYANKDNKGIFKEPELIVGWFKQQCIQKDERFIIFPDKKGKKHIVPCDCVDKIFQVTGNFRPKQSGSRPIPIRMRKPPLYKREEIVNLAIQHFKTLKIVVKSWKLEGKHTVLTLDKSYKNIQSEKDKYFENDSFYISTEMLSEFQVRLVKCSNTRNENVMTVLKLKDSTHVPVDGLELLKKEIEKEIKLLNTKK